MAGGKRVESGVVGNGVELGAGVKRLNQGGCAHIKCKVR